jgi:alpha-ketoglutaric semialdehyde dehydrogenase
MATTASDTYKNFIGGEWVDAASGETFESTSPANGETIGDFPSSGAEDVDRAVAAAKEAFVEWRLVPAPKRGEILFRLARLLEEEKSALTDLMTHEMGKVKAEAGGDVQEAIDITYYMAGEGRRLFGQTTPSELQNKWNMSIRVPIGVVGAITPWNFPVAIPSWKLVPALICGNTVVLKPAEDTPALAERFVALLSEAGIPDGVVNIVHGYGESAGEALVRHPDVPVITFTGSRETGILVAKGAAERLKHLHVELGGKNAIIVLDDADLDLAVDGIVWSAFGTSGQRCTAASRVIVQRGAYDELQKRLVARAEAMRLGPGWEDGTDIGPVINRAALDKIHSYTGIGKDEGATLLTGGEPATDGDLGKGFYYHPTVFGDVEAGMRIANEEIFGPTTALIPVSDFDEAIHVANAVGYGLSSSIFTRDVNKAFRAMRDLEAGITYVNAGTIGAEVHLPFGGTKETGNGHREAGQAALDVFTEWKSIYVDYSGRLQRAQIDTEQ